MRRVLSVSSIAIRPAASAIGATPLGVRASKSSTDTRQTVGDVVTRDTTGVEGAHRQLGAGLTDRLGGDDADRLADVDELARGQRTAVALGAGADLGLAGQDRADLDLADAVLDQRVDRDVAEVGAGRQHDLAVDLDVRGQAAGVDGGLDVVVLAQLAVRALDRDRQDEAALGAAVVLADDDVLRRRRPDDGSGSPSRRYAARCRPDPCGHRGVEMKYSSTDRPSRKLALIGRGMISPFGLATRPRIPAIWRICIQLPRAPELTIR